MQKSATYGLIYHFLLTYGRPIVLFIFTRKRKSSPIFQVGLCQIRRRRDDFSSKIYFISKEIHELNTFIRIFCLIY